MQKDECRRKKVDDATGSKQSLLEWLISHYPTAKRQTFKQMLAGGRITVNGRRPRSLRDLVSEVDQVEISDRTAMRPLRSAAEAPFTIVHEDRDVLVIDKLAGLLTSTNERERRPTAWAAVQSYLAANDPKARPGLIHRLDRDASGLLVFSKNDAAYRHLKQQFLRHSVLRIYIASVHGALAPATGRLESRLVELADGRVRSTRRPGKGQRAITDYETISTCDGVTILRLTLQTGRKHQIRAQLAEKGTPIIDDPVYGDRQSTGRLMLVATELAFDHPRTGRRMSFRLDGGKTGD
jgi:23S rRNA pseudouridine1911/1915/1917 synthase